MSMYGMNNLSEVFGGKIPGLNKPVSFESEGLVSKDNIEKSPFREPKILTKGTGFSDTVMSLKGRNNVPKGSTADIEGKIFGNVKTGNILSRKTNNVNFSGFEQMLYSGKGQSKGQVFNDFIARNRSVKTPVGDLQVVNVASPSMGKSGKFGEGAVDTWQQGGFDTYGEQYGRDNSYAPGIIETAENVGRGIVTVGTATGKGLAALGSGLGKGLKVLGEGTGIIETPEAIQARMEQQKALLTLQNQARAQMLQQQMMAQYGGYGGGYGYNPMLQGMNPQNMQTGFGMMGNIGTGIIGPKTTLTPQQKVIQGYGMGSTGGVSPENIRFAAGFRGAQPKALEYAGFIPANEPFSAKVIQSLGNKKLKEEYKELQGGQTYPRVALAPMPSPLMPIPQQPQTIIVQQPMPMQQQYPQQMQQQPQPIPMRVTQQQPQAGVQFSPYSKKKVTYVRGPYRSHKPNYIPPSQNVQQGTTQLPYY